MNGLRRVICIAAVGVVLKAASFGQGLDVLPGVDRWPIKTSILKKSRSKFIPLRELLTLPNPIANEGDASDTGRIPTKVGTGGLKEGDFVSTTGWLQLVALERAGDTKRDGDYHIQIRTDSTWADTCLVVEVPYPNFITDPSLKNSASDVRAFIREKLLKNKEPGTSGNVMSHPVYVTLKGQLFFDAPHLAGSPRGKRGMRSYTPWEIHPIVSMWLEKKPSIH